MGPLDKLPNQSKDKLYPRIASAALYYYQN